MCEVEVSGARDQGGDGVIGSGNGVEQFCNADDADGADGLLGILDLRTATSPTSFERAHYVATLRPRSQSIAAAKRADGIQIQTSSLLITRAPHSLKNARTLIGDTWIGVNGKK